MRRTDIKRSGSQPSAKGPAEYFTGSMRIDAPFQGTEPARGSSQAELARDYVQLRGTQEQIRVAHAIVRVNEQILNVVRIRKQRGLVTSLDTSNAA